MKARPGDRVLVKGHRRDEWGVVQKTWGTQASVSFRSNEVAAARGLKTWVGPMALLEKDLNDLKDQKDGEGGS